MAKSIERQCPACKEVKLFRADQKTCGCKGSNPNLVVRPESERPIVAEPEALKKLLLKKPHSPEELIKKLGTTLASLDQATKVLEEAGHNLSIQDGKFFIQKEVPTGGTLVVNSADFYDGEWYKFGALGDTHLYSKHARLDVLNCLYDIYEREGIKTVFHTGNAIDGECRFNKFDLVGRAGMGPQLEYFANEYPQRKGMTTRFITGDDHEGWYIQREGVNIGKMMQHAAEDAGRSDLVWIGHVEADVHFKAEKGEAWMRVMHPGGGSAYATSYTEQKLVESFQGGDKPHILLMGHYHKLNQGYSREVHTVQCGCTQDQTTFMRKLKLQAHVGGTIVSFHQAPTGEINRFRVEFFPFYDRHFYESKDKYERWK